MNRVEFVEKSSGIYRVVSSDSPFFARGTFVTNKEVVAALNDEKVKVSVVAIERENSYTN